MRTTAWILTLTALAPLVAAEPESPTKPEKTDAEKKAAAEADGLYDFLRSVGTPKKDANKASNAYEKFRLKPAGDRKKEMTDLRQRRLERDAAHRTKEGARLLKSKGLTPGRGFWNNAESLDKLRVDIQNLAEKDPQEYERLMQDPDRRANMLKRYGFGAPEDVKALEPFVFGDLQAWQDERDIAAALKARKLPDEDVLWVLNAVPDLGDLVREAKTGEKSTKK